jgi:hypothetical protein
VFVDWQRVKVQENVDEVSGAAHACERDGVPSPDAFLAA